jgi:hypothetical protein
MRISSRFPLLVALAALSLTAPVIASAEPPPSASEVAPAGAPSKAPDADAERYAARETKDQSVAAFQGGDALIITGSALAVVLIVVLVVVLL